MFNGVQVLILAAAIVGAVVTIPAAMRHDRLLEELEAIDYDALDEEADQHFTDDCDSWRKGES